MSEHTTDPRYLAWIRENYGTQERSYGACAEATERMRDAFPELLRVRGHYRDAVWGEREHWWCVTVDGSIVDPTRDQFPSKGVGEYVEMAPDAEEPIGMCANCGEYSYASKGGGETCCSPRCEDEYAAYLGVTISR